MTEKQTITKATAGDYVAGFDPGIASDVSPKGISENIIQFISKKRDEPKWLLNWRLKAFHVWQTMREPTWANVSYPPIDYQNIHYYAAPKNQTLNSLDEADPDLLKTFERLGVPMGERAALAGVAVDAVMDSVSVATTLNETLDKLGIIFCSLGEAIRKYPELVRQHLGTVVPHNDNFFAALNAAVFSDGSFCYLPKGVRCPVELSTYFRMNAPGAGQFERTLIVAENESYASYLEGCTAPRRNENQLHAAVVEIVAKQNAEVHYATVQNWYPGDEHGNGGVYNFVTKRGIADTNAKISWTQVETGSAITWKYPSVILKGDNSHGEFYSIAVTKNHQQADTGTKMVHLGKNSSSTVISKGIAAGRSSNSYRGLVKVIPRATGVRNFSQCDSLILGALASAHTFPTLDIHHHSAHIEHEATTSTLSDEQLFYLQSRGIAPTEAAGLIVNGFCRTVLDRLPFEFAAEAKQLLTLTLEDAIA